MVRLLHDPELVDRVYQQPEATLARADLTPREREWLVSPDRRAWKTDPYRRARLLTGLIDEYPASMAVALRSGGTADLLAFFSAEHFADCVHGRGSLALAFGAWLTDGLADVGPEETTHLARVELAIATVRRAASVGPGAANDPSAHEHLVRAPTVDAFGIREGTVERLAAIRGRLGQHGGALSEAVADSTFDLPAGAATPGAEREYVLVDLGPDGAQLGFCPGELVMLLDAARDPVPAATLWRRAGALGADPDDERAIVAGLLRDGSLVRAPSPG